MPTQFDNFATRLGVNAPKRKSVGFQYAPQIVGDTTPGQAFKDKITERKDAGFDIFSKGRNELTSRIATEVVDKSANQVPTDEFGLVKSELTNLHPTFEKQLSSISRRGDLALQGEEAKAEWHRLKNLQDLGQYAFTGSIQVNGSAIPGASANNPGAKAVALAMQAYKNRTPYVWGGNSLSRGIDCSGLVQQVYRKLGISLPRTTYQQAKSGRRVSLGSLRPGDLVFYNTGSRDPNGIGRYGHVALYMGNGKIVEAANSRSDMRISSLTNYNGRPSLAIRPY